MIPALLLSAGFKRRQRDVALEADAQNSARREFDVVAFGHQHAARRTDANAAQHAANAANCAPEHATHTLPLVARLWGRRVTVETVAPEGDDGLGPVWFTCNPGDPAATRLTEAPAP